MNPFRHFGRTPSTLWLLDYGLDDRASFAGSSREFFSSPQSPDQLGPTQPPIQRLLGVKQSGCEADHSPPSSAEVKNAWKYTSTLPYVLMAWCLLKLRDKLTFTFRLSFSKIYISNRQISRPMRYTNLHEIHLEDICTTNWCSHFYSCCTFLL
jgi:hypothetical protein